MLCSGLMVYVAVSVGRKVTGSRLMSVSVKAGTLIVVVIVLMPEAPEDNKVVVKIGQLRVVVEPRGYGGSTRIQGAEHVA
jgi:hypothetical protein